MAAGRWVGRGDKNGADGAAVKAMRTLVSHRLDERRRRHRRGREGRGADALQRRARRRRHRPRVRHRRGPDRRHHAHRQGHAQRDLRAGRRRPRHDVRPVRGLLHGQAGHRPGGRRLRRHQRAPSSVNIRRVAKAKGCTPEDVTVVILDRPRHEGIVKEIRETGARIKFISDGDVAGAIMAVREGTGVDLLLGIGGTPEGIISACAIKCLGGTIQGKLWPKDDEERQRALDAGHDLDRVLTPTTWSAATTSSSSPPASPTASCCAACATAPRRRPPSRW